MTALPDFRGLPLPEPADLIVGGHEIRSTSFAASAEEFRQASGVFDKAWLDACRDELAAASARVKPGPRLGLSPTVAKLGNWEPARPARTAREAVQSISADLEAFIAAESIDHLIVLNVSSTEPPFPLLDVHQTLGDARAEARRSRSGASSRQLALCLGRDRPRAHVHQLHAVPGGLVPGAAGAGRVDRPLLRAARTARPARR